MDRDLRNQSAATRFSRHAHRIQRPRRRLIHRFGPFPRHLDTLLPWPAREAGFATLNQRFACRAANPPLGRGTPTAGNWQRRITPSALDLTVAAHAMNAPACHLARGLARQAERANVPGQLS